MVYCNSRISRPVRYAKNTVGHFVCCMEYAFTLSFYTRQLKKQTTFFFPVNAGYVKVASGLHGCEHVLVTEHVSSLVLYER